MLNHDLYHDITISEENMATFSETELPVYVVQKANLPDGGEGLAVYETDDAGDGDCSFLVQMITGLDFAKMTYQKRRLVA